MIAYKDFGIPKIGTSGTFLKTATVVTVPFDTGVQEANAWLEEEGRDIQVLSVETVQLDLNHPFLRVWYTRRRTAE